MKCMKWSRRCNEEGRQNEGMKGNVGGFESSGWEGNGVEPYSSDLLPGLVGGGERGRPAGLADPGNLFPMLANPWRALSHRAVISESIPSGTAQQSNTLRQRVALYSLAIFC